MKVALIVDSYKPKTGGPSVILKETRDALIKKNINVKIISNDFYKNKGKKLLRLNINKFDICHLYGGWTYFHIQSFLLALNLKKKIIIHPLGYYEPWSLNQKKIKKKIAWNIYQKKILSNADMIHCASKLEKKNLLKQNKFSNIKVIPYGIADNLIKKKIRKKKTRKKVIFFSRIHKKKGLENLIKAWINIDDKNWSLDICGPAESKKYLKKLISMTDKNNKINFLNPIYNLKKKKIFFDKYDFMVLPTHSENFGFIILESLARGLPVLTTKNTPWTEIQKKNAGWISGASCASLTLNLKKIFKESEKNKNSFFVKSKNACLLSKVYSWKNVSNLYVKNYRGLMSE